MSASASGRTHVSGDNCEAPRFLRGDSVSTRRLVDEIDRVAAFDSSVLITGPSGTGKELVARQLHACSQRSSGLFIPVDCTLLSGDLMASQLFGQVVGAFTGATHATLGCFRSADGGTLFFDEIGEMPLELQAKLLRAIQERTVTPVGGEEPISVDVRIVAATNRDLRTEVTEGRFREDLYYRLNVVHIATTALSERTEDVEALVEQFLDQMVIAGLPRKTVSPGALTRLREFSWPGNVRQLRNLLEQCVIEADSDLITMPLVERLLGQADRKAESAPEVLLPPDSARAADAQVTDGPQAWETLADLEKSHIIATLEKTYYNRSVAARLLGVTRQTLLRRMQKHNISTPPLPGIAKRSR